MTHEPEATAPESIRAFRQIKEHVALYDVKLSGLQSPAEKHQRAMDVLDVKLAGAWDDVFNAPPAQRLAMQKEIQQYAVEKERLEASYQSNLKEEEAAYSCKADDLFDEFLGQLYKSVALSKPPTVDDTATSTSLEKTQAQNPAPGPGKEQAGLSQSGKSPARGASHEQMRKRKREAGLPTQQKRQRLENARNSGPGKRSIHFDAVFQNGNAPVKHVIVQWPQDHGNWYIVRCEEHGLNFKDNPLLAGSVHLGRGKHQKKQRDYGTVIEMLGYEVLGCDKNLAAKNNAAARRTFKTGHEPPAADSIEVSEEIPSSPSEGRGEEEEQVGERPRRQGRGSSRRNGLLPGSDAVTNPAPGEVYLVYWRRSKQWLAGLLLPLKDLSKVGVSNSIENLGLLSDLPECYAYDSSSKTFLWRVGYEDDGPKVAMREFPVMFFDGLPFPDESTVAWVPAEDIQIYDSSAMDLIAHHQQVQDYFDSRHGKSTDGGSDDEQRDSTESPDAPEDSGPEPPTEDASTEQQGSQEPTGDSESTVVATRATTPQQDTQSTNERPLPSPAKQLGGATKPNQDRPGNSSTGQDDAVARRHSIRDGPVTASRPASSQSTIPASDETAFDQRTFAANEEALTPTQEKETADASSTVPSTGPEATRMAQLACSVMDQTAMNRGPERPSITPASHTDVASQNPISQHYLEGYRGVLTAQSSAATSPGRVPASPRMATFRPGSTHPTNAQHYPQSNPSSPRPEMVSIPHKGPRTMRTGPGSGPLPPIRPREEHSPSVQPRQYPRPNAASASPRQSSRPFSRGSTNGHSQQSRGSDSPPPQAGVPTRYTGWLSNFTPRVARDLLQVTGSSDQILQPEDFLNYQCRYQCPFCRVPVDEARAFTQHLQQLCRSMPPSHRPTARLLTCRP
ncbi:hypothetical protein FALBO_6035 [Fusarium albosuccineum]|uniref:Uncharacterized protein n=1 Tax=Fusarium albosuccineum TaxID=1237068 RepID=A0A8H4P993_9HYPO|nr:hypothetical protein FALBO_6035 [Fusarium albosuccineum]